MDNRNAAEQIFRAGISRVLPDRLIRAALSLEGDILGIDGRSFNLREFRNIFVIGAGKASALMGVAVESILGSRISGGHIVVKHGHGIKMKRIAVTEAGHPIPDANGFMASRTILDICTSAGNEDLVICLLSGGGSALLTDFPGGSGPEEIMRVNDLLVKCGASIGEINTVRKHLSSIKGGQLSSAVYPGTIISLILSDVVGDPLDVIASGPTVPDPTTFGQALDVLAKYNITHSVPSAILYYLTEGASGHRTESPKPGDTVFRKTFNFIVGNNKLALEACSRKAAELNFNPFIISDRIEGDAALVSSFIGETVNKFADEVAVRKPLCLLFGGEPAVRVTGRGKGGRNQHLALLLSRELRGKKGITILSAGTDGTDGPTSAAGAVVDCNTWSEALSRSMDPEEYLVNFDSNTFFRLAGGLIVTGPTRTNVMDIVVVLIE